MFSSSIYFFLQLTYCCPCFFQFPRSGPPCVLRVFSHSKLLTEHQHTTPDNIMGQKTLLFSLHSLPLNETALFTHTMYLGISREPLENKIKQQQQTSCAPLFLHELQPSRASTPPDYCPGICPAPNCHQRASEFSLITEQFKDCQIDSNPAQRNSAHLFDRN